MNLQQMKKNTGVRVRITPTACFLDELDREITKVDDVWIIGSVTDDEIEISNIRTSHRVILGSDHIHNYKTDPNRSVDGLRYAFLVLHVQIFIQGDNARVEPTLRPGERVAPRSVKMAPKFVEQDYPLRSGLLAKFRSAGYKLSWCSEARLSTVIDIEGWELVIEKGSHNELVTFKLSDYPNQILIKKKE